MIFQSIAGLLTFAGIAWLLSENRKQVKLNIAVTGIVLQLLVGLILLKIPIFRDLFLLLNRLVLSIERGDHSGSSHGDKNDSQRIAGISGFEPLGTRYIKP